MDPSSTMLVTTGLYKVGRTDLQRFAMILTHAVLLFNMPDSTAPIIFTSKFSE
jgi:hypothetical protein